MCVCEMLSARKKYGEPDDGSQRDGEKEVLATNGLHRVRKQAYHSDQYCSSTSPSATKSMSW